MSTLQNNQCLFCHSCWCRSANKSLLIRWKQINCQSGIFPVVLCSLWKLLWKRKSLLMIANCAKIALAASLWSTFPYDKALFTRIFCQHVLFDTTWASSQKTGENLCYFVSIRFWYVLCALQKIIYRSLVLFPKRKKKFNNIENGSESWRRGDDRRVPRLLPVRSSHNQFNARVRLHHMTERRRIGR